jgi:hypothetical protein
LGATGSAGQPVPLQSMFSAAGPDGAGTEGSAGNALPDGSFEAHLRAAAW